MSTATHTPVDAFAAAVRDALSDLPADEVDELTGGLEADLADRAADGDADLGDPVAYAEELRMAAGLPAKGSAAPRRASVVGTWVSATVDRARLLLGHPRARAVVGLLVSLRPAWWLLRGWMAYLALEFLFGQGNLLPRAPFWAVVLVAALLASVQVGRGRWLGGPRLRWLVIGMSVVAAVTAPFALGRALAIQEQAQYAYYDDSVYYQGGLQLNGTAVTNIFPFGADGQPLEGVRLFDQNGDAIDLVEDPSQAYSWDDYGTVLVPSGQVPGRTGWNVVPLQQADEEFAMQSDDGTAPTATPTPVVPPFASVSPLADYAPPVVDPQR